MAIIQKDGFDFFDDIKGNPESFILKGENIEEEVKYIQEKKIINITLAGFITKGISNFDFLEKINFIEALQLLDLDSNYLGLYYLENLKSLTLSVKNKNQYIDFSKFKNLEYLSIDWYSKFPDLSLNDKLKELVIWKFKPKSKSFKEIKLPISIENLEITESNLLNLEGLYLPNLKKFEGHYCNSLESLSGIQNLGSSLNTLILDYCRKISDYIYLGECQNLNKLILGNCGDIENLSWLKKIKNLKHFSFYETKLLDGDTSPCFGIDYVSFKNLKNYNHKVEEFRTK